MFARFYVFFLFLSRFFYTFERFSLLFELFASMACSTFFVLLSACLIVDVIFAVDQLRATSECIQMCNKIKVQNKTLN